MSWREVGRLIAATASEWNEDRVARMAASLAFYTVFSIAPMLVIAIWLAGQVFGAEAASREVSEQLSLLMGRTAARGVESLVRSANAQADGGWVATILGILLLLYTSTNVFAELQDSMNTIWEVKARPGKLWWQILRDRLVSFVMVLGIAFLLMVSLVLSAALTALSRYIASEAAVWNAVNHALSLVVFAMLFALMFKYLPDAKVRWRDVAIGAVFTSVLFNLGKLAIGYYLGRESVSSVYGAAGSVAILLLWVYYSAQILYIGAEFTQVYARRHGQRVEPERGAVVISEEERVQQGIPHKETVDGAAEKQAEDLVVGITATVRQFSDWGQPSSFRGSVSGSLSREEADFFDEIWREASDEMHWREGDLLASTVRASHAIRERFPSVPKDVADAVVRAMSYEWR